MQVEIPRLRFPGRPNRILVPGVRPALERARFPAGLLTPAVQKITEERGFDVGTKLAGCLVSSERNNADAITLGAAPFAVKPGARHHEINVIRIMFFGVAEDLP